MSMSVRMKNPRSDPTLEGMSSHAQTVQSVRAAERINRRVITRQLKQTKPPSPSHSPLTGISRGRGGGGGRRGGEGRGMGLASANALEPTKNSSFFDRPRNRAGVAEAHSVNAEASQSQGRGPRHREIVRVQTQPTVPASSAALWQRWQNRGSHPTRSSVLQQIPRMSWLIGGP